MVQHQNDQINIMVWDVKHRISIICGASQQSMMHETWDCGSFEVTNTSPTCAKTTCTKLHNNCITHKLP